MLAYHVDYFNGAWKDPFSSRLWTERQREYVSALKELNLYTPMVVVMGQEAGYSTAKLAASITRRAAEAPAARVSVSAAVEGGKVVVRAAVENAGALPAGARVFAAIAEDGLMTRPRAGENGGVELHEHGVVRALLAGLKPGSGLRWEVPLEAGWKPAGLRAVVFVQDPATKTVYGAAESKLTPVKRP